MKKLLHFFISIFFILALTGCSINSKTNTPSPLSGQRFVVHYLDVGQGDSEILQYGNRSTLIDAGTNASTTALIDDIKRLGITRFDIVVATHPHEDHIGGMDAVIRQFDIGTFYMPDVTTATQTYTDMLKALKDKHLTPVYPKPGTMSNLGAVQLKFLAPNSASYTDLNNYSIVVKATFGSTSFLFTGDAQTQSEEEMLAKGYDLKADVLKVGHHGSDTATSPAFLAAVNPKLAVISLGADNDYGFPDAVTLKKLAGAGVTTYRTDLNGTITVTSDGTNLDVNTEK